jgi:hypothetical protein
MYFLMMVSVLFYSYGGTHDSSATEIRRLRLKEGWTDSAELNRTGYEIYRTSSPLPLAGAERCVAISEEATVDFGLAPGNCGLEVRKAGCWPSPKGPVV